MQSLPERKKKQKRWLLLIFSRCCGPNNYCLHEILFSHATTVLYWQRHVCWILVAESGGGKAEGKRWNRWCQDQGCKHSVKVNIKQGNRIVLVIETDINLFIKLIFWMKQTLRIWLRSCIWKPKWPEAWENLNPRQGMTNAGRQWHAGWIPIDLDILWWRVLSIRAGKPGFNSTGSRRPWNRLSWLCWLC